MRIKDLLNTVMKNLMRNKVRTIVNCIIIFTGILAFIVTVSLSNSIIEAAKKGILENASLCEVTVSEAIGSESSVKLDSTCYNLLSELPHVKTLYADLQFTAGIFENSDECGVAFVESRPQEAIPELLYGERYSETDTECIILPSHITMGENTYESREFLNKDITLQCTLYDKDGEEYVKNYKFKVSGIYNENSMENFQNVVFINVNKMNELQAERRGINVSEYVNTVTYNNIMIQIDKESNVEDVCKKIESYGYKTYSILEELDSIPGVARYVGVIGTIICIIVMVTAIICIWTTTAQAAKLREGEIGIMKAIGYTPGNVTSIMMLETIITSIIAEVTAMIAALFMLNQTVNFFSKNEQFKYMTAGISIETIMLSLVICLAIPLIGGAYPLYKCSKISPSVALKKG